MGRLLDLVRAAEQHVSVARSAIMDLDKELEQAKKDIASLDAMKEAHDKLQAEISDLSAQHATETTKLAEIKALRTQLAELRHNG